MRRRALVLLTLAVLALLAVGQGALAQEDAPEGPAETEEAESEGEVADPPPPTPEPGPPDGPGEPAGTTPDQDVPLPSATVPALDAPSAFFPMPGSFDVSGPPSPVIVGSGADALIRAPSLRGDNEPTLLERYGSQGHAIDSVGGFGGDSDRALNALAGSIFAVATWLAQAVVATFQWSFTIEVFEFLGDAVSTIVGALEVLLYSPFVIVLVILAGLSMTWQGLVRRRGTLAFEQAVWTVFALAVAALFFASPSALIDGANKVSTGLSRAVLAGVSVADPKTGPDDGITTRATFDGHAADDQLRMAGDRFWRVFVHQPWLVLQFGDLDTGREFGERLLAARTITADEYAAVESDPEAMAALTESKREEHLALQEEIFADPRAAEWFRGRRAVERVGVATLALAGVSVGGVLLVLVAAAVLLAQVGFLLLVLLGPVALLIGIHPGTGRLIAIRWAELLAGLLIKRITLGALLAAILVVNGVLLDAAYPLGWLVVMGLQTLVVAAAVVYRKPFTQLIGPTTVPVLGMLSQRGSPASGSARAEPGAAQGADVRVRLGQAAAAVWQRPRRGREPLGELPSLAPDATHGPEAAPWSRWRRARTAARLTADADGGGNGETGNGERARLVEVATSGGRSDPEGSSGRSPLGSWSSRLRHARQPPDDGGRDQ